MSRNMVRARDVSRSGLRSLSGQRSIVMDLKGVSDGDRVAKDLETDWVKSWGSVISNKIETIDLDQLLKF